MSGATETFYSQHGEDAVLGALFPSETDGFFVEVGCIDGRRFSNTLALEERGWRGICVEAHRDYIAALRRNRPRAAVCHCAVGAVDEEVVPFYANRRGSLSTLDRSQEAGFRARFGHYFSGFEVQQVPLQRLATILERHQAPPPDVLSVDVEGGEADVLRGLDLHRWPPRVMVIEADSPADEAAVDAILLPAGYHKSVRLACNRFYLIDAADDARLRNRRFCGTLTHTRHPLDDGDDQHVPFSFAFDEPGHAR